MLDGRSAPAVNLTTTDIAPMPVALASNGTIVAGSYITRPLVAIWGKKVGQSPFPLLSYLQGASYIVESR